MKTTIQAIQSRPGQRILVTSDVHGHLGHLAELLRRAEYGGDDILVIVGDLIDKGPESLATLRYCRELAQEGDVYISLGNVDAGRLRRLADSGEGAGLRFLKLVRWLWEEWGCGLVLDMLAELGIPVSKLTEENAEEYRRLLCRHFAGEIAFLQGLPVILETGRYIFVHGGIPTDALESLAGCDGMEFLKNNAFMEKGYRFSRCVVVGHWPACLYNREYETAEPVFNRAQNIISMDGGCGLKRGCRLLSPGRTRRAARRRSISSTATTRWKSWRSGEAWRPIARPAPAGSFWHRRIIFIRGILRAGRKPGCTITAMPGWRSGPATFWGSSRRPRPAAMPRRTAGSAGTGVRFAGKRRR